MSEYRSMEGVNQSSLKQLLVSPKKYLAAVEKQEDSSGDHFVFGTLVDIIALEGKEAINNKFYVSDLVLPSDTVAGIIKSVYDTVSSSGEDMDFADLDMLKEYVSSAVIAANYQPNWKIETRVDKIIELGKGYFDELKRCGKRIPISRDTFDSANLLATVMTSGKATSKYFTNTAEIEVRTHVPISFVYEGIDCKAELDILYINHKEKLIKEIDIKTTSVDVEFFSGEFFKYRYDFQRAFYRLAIIHGLLNQEEFKDYGYAGSILIVGNVNDMRVVPYVVPSKYLHEEGFVTNNGKVYEGPRHAIDRLKYHRATEVWEFPREYYSNEGHLLIQDGYEKIET